MLASETEPRSKADYFSFVECEYTFFSIFLFFCTVAVSFKLCMIPECIHMKSGKIVIMYGDNDMIQKLTLDLKISKKASQLAGQ